MIHRTIFDVDSIRAVGCTRWLEDAVKCRFKTTPLLRPSF